MIRAIVVLASTFLFAAFGLVVGYLNVQAAAFPGGGGRVSTDALLFSYGVAPLTGAVLGFVLSIVALRLFASNERT